MAENSRNWEFSDKKENQRLSIRDRGKLECESQISAYSECSKEHSFMTWKNCKSEFQELQSCTENK